MTPKRKKDSDPTANQEVPLVNATLERSMLAAVIDAPELLKSIHWCPDHFALDANKWVARSIERVAQSDVVNITNVAIALKDAGRLEQVGGTPYLAQLQDCAAYKMPTEAIADAQSWARQLRELHEKRVLLAEARSLVAVLATGAVDDHFEAYERSLQRVESIKPRDSKPLGFIMSAWGDLRVEPERETWLLVDDFTGKPALPIGRTSILAAAGGTGKTTVLVQLSISVALGLPWCGFRIETPGMVVLCCAESDEKLMHRQVWRGMNALELNDEERALCSARVVCMPLEGIEVNMIRGEGGNLERTEFLERFKRELIQHAQDAHEQLALVILDPLSRFAGSDTEKDNAAATRFIQAIETITKLPGTPAVMCAHHATKATPNGKGPPQAATVSRGVSAIRDGVRSMLGMVRHKCEGVVGIFLECDKSNEAPHFESRWLVQQQGDRGGTLRLSTEAESAMLEESYRPKKRKRGFVEPPTPTDKHVLQDALLAKIRQLGGSVRSRDWMIVNHMTGWRKSEMIAGFKELIELGLITIETNGKNKGTVWLTEQSKQDELPFSRSENSGTNGRNEVRA